MKWSHKNKTWRVDTVAKYYDTIIIGAGQAGLAMGYYIKKNHSTFIILEKNKRVGDSWRNRYDSLMLFTPRSYSALPGLRLQGEQSEYPTKDEVANYLEDYSNKFTIPIQFNTSVKGIQKIDETFQILTTSGGIYFSKNVIVATGPFQQPFYPDFEKHVPNNIFQIHSAHYKNPNQLSKETTVVVGGGNSGMQIATELSLDREVYLSISKKPKFFPYEMWNRSIFWWFDLLGISKATVHSKIGKFIRKNDPIIGRESKQLIDSGRIKLLTRGTIWKGEKMFFEDGTFIKPKNIIWATGYYSDYKWIDIPEVFTINGNPIHTRGITTEQGLYFLGLSWQYKRSSALLNGVGGDAAFIASKL